ncbi:alpha-ketoglutarate-dependent dioxygenase AlkB [Halomonas sp. ML-15]|uniref:alpha-ketoglutarate-dependent dioxygenase AlkB family protein n=1 Tax=Halomonas sp. ML-15 TaxID=2773305 RepID=UPI001746EA14|nr:alpha-ketoglutarate-dependent dioxygenase AlkB [Halomonas sp. ML-15]MBD3894305.1 alpha-ketoglutarate-dependent dioxygenase AlkB [Halomonas sp. ML-15]
MHDSPGWQTLLESPPLWRQDALLGAGDANRLLECLDRELDWQQPTLTLFGREHPIPRRQVWMGDPDARYRYSGRDFTPQEWHPEVAHLAERINRAMSAQAVIPPFNSALLNRYASGEERMGWHSDDEPELGTDPLIAALSLGSARPLRFRWKDRRAPAFNVDLPHGSLLVMGRGVQRQLQHALLPRRRHGLRISLTFRHIVTTDGPQQR